MRPSPLRRSTGSNLQDSRGGHFSGSYPHFPKDTPRYPVIYPQRHYIWAAGGISWACGCLAIMRTLGTQQGQSASHFQEVRNFLEGQIGGRSFMSRMNR